MTTSDDNDRPPMSSSKTTNDLVEGVAALHDHLTLTMASVIAPEDDQAPIADYQVMLVCEDFDGHTATARLSRIKSLVDSMPEAAALRALTPAQWHLFTPQEALVLSEDFDEEPTNRGTSWH